MRRDATAPNGYFCPVRKLLFLGLLCLPLATVLAESIELKDGSQVEGKILSVTPETVLIEVQTTPTIREEKSYPRADVVKIQRASQDDIAYEEIAAIALPATADDPSVYDAPLEKIRAFMKDYAYSKHMPQARQQAVDLEAERTRVATGGVKIDGSWIDGGTGAAGPDRVELESRVQLAKMKQAGDPVSALLVFETLEKSGNASSSYPESVKFALSSIEKLRANVARTRADLARRTGEQQQGLQLASEDRRLQMEAGIAQEKAAVQAQIDRARQSGTKWMPVLPDDKVLDDLDKLADSEEARLAKVDVQTLVSALDAAQEARGQIEAGKLEEAKASLARAEKLWSQHVLLASLKESLKKAEEEAARRAKEKEQTSSAS